MPDGPLRIPTGSCSGHSGFEPDRPILRAHEPARRHRGRLSGGLDKARAEGETRAAVSGLRGLTGSMITGFNTNVRHGGRLFHVQTEDSGKAYPHVISHVYYGGTILASEKHDYEDLLGTDDVAEAVRALMEGQHKAMVARLKQGALDPVILERLTDPAEDTGPGVSDPPPAAPAIPAAAAAASRRPASTPARAFGEGIVSQKPLDEVILEYLVEKARGRGSASKPPANPPARESRPKG